MTNRERFLKVMNFEQVDRLPMIEWATWWDKTIEAWVKQGFQCDEFPGLPKNAAIAKTLGLDMQLQRWYGFRTKRTPVPAYHGAPLVTSMEEYERILPTIFPENPVDIDELKLFKQYQDTGEAIVWITLEGPFWGPRGLMGIEGHLFGFYDNPELMHRINDDICNYNLRVIDEVYRHITPDFMTFAEDMSYNNGPMISEDTFNEFLLPYYQRMVPRLKELGTRVIIDSDGDITKALPWFANAGLEGILPLERQAGVDLEKLRTTHPKMRFMGHFDKMCMPKGEEAMQAEFERLLPMMRAGGFIPSVDHQTPPGVTFEQYKIYMKLFREYANKGANHQ